MASICPKCEMKEGIIFKGLKKVESRNIKSYECYICNNEWAEELTKKEIEEQR